MTVIEKGTTTDANGAFSSTVEKNNGTLIFFFGFSSQEIAIANRTAIDVKQEADIKILGVIVVIGCG